VKPKPFDETKEPNYPRLDKHKEAKVKEMIETEAGRKALAAAMYNPIRGSAPGPFVSPKEPAEFYDSRTSGVPPSEYDEGFSGGLGPGSFDPVCYNVVVNTKDLNINQIYYLVVILRRQGFVYKEAFYKLKDEESVILYENVSENRARKESARILGEKGILTEIVKV